MECLIKHKNEPEVRQEHYKCRAAVEHFQLISLKNYKFTFKFKQNCKPYVARYCPHSSTKYLPNILNFYKSFYINFLF